MTPTIALPNTGCAIATSATTSGAVDTADDSGAFGRALQGLTDPLAPEAAAFSEVSEAVAEVLEADAAPDLSGWLAELLAASSPTPTPTPTPTSTSNAPTQTPFAALAAFAGLPVAVSPLPADAGAGPNDRAEEIPRAGTLVAAVRGSPPLKADETAPVAGAATAARSDTPATPGFALALENSLPAKDHNPGTVPSATLVGAGPLAAAATPVLMAASPPVPHPVAAAFETTLPAAVTSPAFAPQLGTQIAHFARDGIEHARLQLNPAELGPIAVQLVLDGQQVRVDLVADVAATRQALEQSLPALAGALREAGFTLSGGGVFQHAREGGNPADPRQANGSPNPNSKATADAETPATPATRPQRTQGLVDLFA